MFVYSKPNIYNLHGKIGREIFDEIKNTPPSDLSALRERVKKSKEELMRIRENEKRKRTVTG